MGWWIALGIIALLAVLPLGVSVRYDEDGTLVRIIAGPVKITLFPRPKKNKKPKKEKKKQESGPKEKPAKKKKKKTPKKQTASWKKDMPVKQEIPVKKEIPQPVQAETSARLEKTEEKPPKKGGSITDFLPLVKIALDFLGDFKRKLRVNFLELKLVMAGGDPCDLAVNYGRAWTALGNLLPRLERFLVIKKRDVDVQCDFTASKTTVIARVDLTITLGRLLAAVVAFAVRALIAYLKIMKKRKGGAFNEQKSS